MPSVRRTRPLVGAAQHRPLQPVHVPPPGLSGLQRSGVMPAAAAQRGQCAHAEQVLQAVGKTRCASGAAAVRTVSRLRRAQDGLMLYGLRPLCTIGPGWLWPLMAWCLAALAGPGVALTQAAVLDAILRLSGRPTGWKQRLWLGRHMLHWRLRRLDLYLRGAPDRCQVVWQGEPPAQRLACYVVMDTQGAEQVAAWVNSDAFYTVRKRFGREDPNAPGAPAWQGAWLEHCDRLRGSLAREHVIDPTGGAAELRRLLRSGRNLLFFQGSPSPDPASPLRHWMGRQVPLVLGSVRVARRERLPMRFVQVLPTLTGWTILVEPPVEPDEDWLLARMERQLRECPQGWALWPDFWAVLAHRGSAASTLELLRRPQTQ